MADAGATLLLPAVVDPAAVVALHRDWTARARSPAIIDFSAVREIDSSGVALVRALAAAALSAGHPAPRLQAVPERFLTLCRAHRVHLDGLSPSPP